MFKAMALGAILSGVLGLVIGSQGTSAGVLAIHPFHFADMKLYWSWPIFFTGSGLAFAIIWLQR